MEKKYKRPKKKIFIILSVVIMLFGILLGTLTIFANLNKYFNNISKYTQQDKISLENQIKENDNKYNDFLTQIDDLTKQKEKYVKALADTEKSSADYIIYQDKIKEISSELETLDGEKYSLLAEKNNLQKEYNNVIVALSKKENSYYLISCYFLGFIIIIGAIVLGIVFLHKGYKPDYDDIILENQRKIDEAQKEKREQQKKELAIKKQNNDTQIKNTSNAKEEKNTIKENIVRKENVLPRLKENKKAS